MYLRKLLMDFDFSGTKNKRLEFGVALNTDLKTTITKEVIFENNY